MDNRKQLLMAILSEYDTLTLIKLKTMKSHGDKVTSINFDGSIVLNLHAVGALTAGSSEKDTIAQSKGAKPHTFRPWEVESVDSIDLRDSSLGSVRFQLRGGKIRRVLPRTNDDINGEWATDKGRYAPLDGVNTQEVRNPRIKVSSGNWETVTLNTAIDLASKLSSKGNRRIIYGGTTDCESINARSSWLKNTNSNKRELFSLVPNLKDLSDKVGLKVYSYNEDSKDSDSQESFIPNLPNGLKNVLIIGCDPRIQSPLLNLRLRESYLNGTEFWSVGARSNQTYPIRNLGFSLNRFVENKGNGLNEVNLPKWDLILVGIDIFRGEDAELIASNIKSIAGDKAIRVCTARSNESYIRNHSETNYYGHNDLKSKVYDTQFLVNLTAKEVESAGYNIDNVIGESKETIVITHKGANWRKNTKIILPILNPLEMKASYISRFGGTRVSEIVTKRNESSKHVCSIENLFSKFPMPAGIGSSSNKTLVTPVEGKVKVKNKNVVKTKNTPFIVSLQDYHVEGHPFAEYSSTRAHCSTVFAENQPNFN